MMFMCTQAHTMLSLRDNPFAVGFFENPFSELPFSLQLVTVGEENFVGHKDIMHMILSSGREENEAPRASPAKLSQC